MQNIKLKDVPKEPHTLSRYAAHTKAFHIQPGETNETTNQCLLNSEGQVSATRFPSAIHIPSASFEAGKWYLTPVAQ